MNKNEMELNELIKECRSVQKAQIQLGFKFMFLSLKLYIYVHFMRLINKPASYKEYQKEKKEFWERFAKNYKDLKENLKSTISKEIYFVRIKFYLWLK